jgi:hypothetical protein
MSLPFLNTAPGYDEELRNSVFFERASAAGIAASMGAASRTSAAARRSRTPSPPSCA